MRIFILTAAIALSMTSLVRAEYYLCSADVSMTSQKIDGKWFPRMMSTETSQYIISKVKNSESSYSVRLVDKKEPDWVCESKRKAIFAHKGEIMCGSGSYGFWADLDELQYSKFATSDYFFRNTPGPRIEAGKCTLLVE